jgi:putative tricarboxylic transport membrane protein
VSARMESAPERRRILPVITNLRHGGLVAAASLAAVAVFFIVQAALLPQGSTKLPGPGFFPLVLGIALLVLCVVVGLGVWNEGQTEETVEFGHRDVAVTVLLLLFIPITFESAGAYLTLGGFGFVMLTLIARLGVLSALAGSSGAMIATWYLFHVLLGVQLPLGLLAG